ncbi:type II secretion system protein [bacterium]|nr:type II secretion system protein [bacterium]
MINKLRGFIKSSQSGFTLTEVLLAVAIVGLIAALVLPALVTNYQNETFQRMKDRQIQAIDETIRSLPVKENQASFKDTTMYSDSGSDIEAKSGKFLKKYFRVAKYCGVIASGGTTDCFASEYFEYSDRDKKIIPQADIGLQGACAQLKNGISLCIMPQIGNNAPQVYMDLNGPKGPNVIGRDIFLSDDFELGAQKVSSSTSGSSYSVNSEDSPVITSKEPSKCVSDSDASDVCCAERSSKGQITPGSACCANSNYIDAPACIQTIEVHLDYYPTAHNYNSGDTPYVNITGSRTRTVPANYWDKIPSSLSVRIKCGNGTYQGGQLSMSTLINAIKNSSLSQVNFTGTINDVSCAFDNEDLLWVNNGATEYTQNGIKYVLFKQ